MGELYIWQMKKEVETVPKPTVNPGCYYDRNRGHGRNSNRPPFLSLGGILKLRQSHRRTRSRRHHGVGVWTRVDFSVVAFGLGYRKR